MITLLTGKKGSGKTKRLIALANKALETSKGNVVVVEKGTKLTYDISHKARLIDAEAHHIESVASLYGLVAGVCATNYDVTDILIDGTLKIVNAGPEAIEVLVKEFQKLVESAQVNLVLSVSASDDEIPDSLKEFIHNED